MNKVFCLWSVTGIGLILSGVYETKEAAIAGLGMYAELAHRVIEDEENEITRFVGTEIRYEYFINTEIVQSLEQSRAKIAKVMAEAERESR